MCRHRVCFRSVLACSVAIVQSADPEHARPLPLGRWQNGRDVYWYTRDVDAAKLMRPVSWRW